MTLKSNVKLIQNIFHINFLSNFQFELKNKPKLDYSENHQYKNNPWMWKYC